MVSSASHSSWQARHELKTRPRRHRPEAIVTRKLAIAQVVDNLRHDMGANLLAVGFEARLREFIQALTIG